MQHITFLSRKWTLTRPVIIIHTITTLIAKNITVHYASGGSRLESKSIACIPVSLLLLFCAELPRNRSNSHKQSLYQNYCSAYVHRYMYKNVNN